MWSVAFRRSVENLLKKNIHIVRIRKLANQAFTKKYLLYTNVGISISLSSLGDIIEQHHEKYRGELKKIDSKRTYRMAISGSTVGVICHFWYQYLDRLLPGRSIQIVIKKVIIDQIICSPICISVFFITIGLFESKSLEELRNDIKNKFIRLYAAEWVVWPVAQIVNFYVLPTRYRVLYDNTISLGYDVYTSRIYNND